MNWNPGAGSSRTIRTSLRSARPSAPQPKAAPPNGQIETHRPNGLSTANAQSSSTGSVDPELASPKPTMQPPSNTPTTTSEPSTLTMSNVQASSARAAPQVADDRPSDSTTSSVRNGPDAMDEGRSLYVGNLPFSATPRDLEDLFGSVQM